MEDEIKIVNMISINGTYVDAKSLSDEERKKIAYELNKRALEKIGYIRVEK